MKLEWKSCIRLAITVFVLYVSIYFWEPIVKGITLFLSALSPILVGFFIAYVLNILMSFYERHYFTKFSHKQIIKKTRIPVCVIAAVASFAAIVAGVVMLIIPELISCIKFMIAQIPPFIKSTLNNDYIASIVPKDVILSLEAVNWQDIVSKVAEFVATGVSTAAEAIFSALYSIASVIITVFISIIFSIYFMLSKNVIFYQTRRVTHIYLSKYENKIIYIFRIINDSFHKFIVGQCVEAVILWILCTIGMMIFRFPYAQMISAFIGFTALIPIAGAYIGAFVGAIMILTVSPLQSLLFIVFIIVLQQIEGNFIYPKVVGKSIGLPAVWVLAGITIGGGIMGIFGMLIGVPIFASIYRLVRDDVKCKEFEEASKKAKKTNTI